MLQPENAAAGALTANTTRTTAATPVALAFLVFITTDTAAAAAANALAATIPLPTGAMLFWLRTRLVYHFHARGGGTITCHPAQS